MQNLFQLYFCSALPIRLQPLLLPPGLPSRYLITAMFISASLSIYYICAPAEAAMMLATDLTTSLYFRDGFLFLGLPFRATESSLKAHTLFAKFHSQRSHEPPLRAAAA